MNGSEMSVNRNEPESYPPKKRYILVLVPWVLSTFIILPSLASLDNIIYWLAFIGFAIPSMLFVITGDPGNPDYSDSGDYIFKISKHQSIMLAFIGFSVLFALAAIMNAPYTKETKTDVFLGATSGMMIAIASSVTYIEVRRGHRLR